MSLLLFLHVSAMCRSLLFVPKHILLNCADLQYIRQKYFTASSLNVESFDNQNVIYFIKDAIFIAISGSICCLHLTVVK